MNHRFEVLSIRQQVLHNRELIVQMRLAVTMKSVAAAVGAGFSRRVSEAQGI